MSDETNACVEESYLVSSEGTLLGDGGSMFLYDNGGMIPIYQRRFSRHTFFFTRDTFKGELAKIKLVLDNLYKISYERTYGSCTESSHQD